ncbi:MAG TPA: PAS domain-containing protein [Novosphingobium sp.]
MNEETSAFSEAERLAILASYPSDDHEISGRLNRLAALAAHVCEAPIGLVSLVEAKRQRFVGRAGTGLTGTPREQSFCAHAMLGGDTMIVPDATKDDRFLNNPLVTGEPGIRFYAAYPMKSAEGAPLGAICVIDGKPRSTLTEEQKQSLETLADAAMALLERWRVDNNSRRFASQAQTAIHDLEQRFVALADAMPQMVWSSLPTGYSDYFNGRWCAFVGDTAASCHGDAWMRFLHPDDTERTARIWRHAVETGGIYEIEYRLRHVELGYRWVLVRGSPMRDEAGTIARWIGTCTDIHQQKEDAEHKELLTRELSHRIKNIFAVIGGLISLSIRRNPELSPLGRELQQRVLALGRAHDFVRPHSEKSRAPQGQASLFGMLENLLAPYSHGDGERIRITGDDVSIDDRSATPLALFFHELATNAAKYGGLSTETGHVDVVVTAGNEISLLWRERGGPPASPPAECGFGANLIEMSIIRQLGGRLDHQWSTEGLSVTAIIPAATMAR